MKKSIVFVVSTLCEVGGGEKLLLEGVKYYRSEGYTVYIITWKFDEIALFNGKYENKDIIVLNSNLIGRENVFKRAIDRLKTLKKLRSILLKINPTLILCQGEYDVATVFVTTLFTKLKYIFLIFGQNYQFPHDIGKYSLIFRKHLKAIVNSQQGYIDTISLKMPKVNLVNRFANELISMVRYFAVRKANKLFVFSKSVQWETQLLFNKKPIMLKGAFSREIFDENYDKDLSRLQLNLPANRKLLLSFSRLVPKKRIELGIKALTLLDDSYHLAIAGKGPAEEYLKKTALDLGVLDRVTFLGFINESDANKLKSCCDIFLSMDIGDFDISPFEALALGVKTIMPPEMDVEANLKLFKNFHISEAEHIALKNKIEEIINQPIDANYKLIMNQYCWESYFQSILNNI